MRLTRHIHVGSAVTYGTAKDIAPDITFEGEDEHMLLGFVDDGGEINFYVIDDTARGAIIQALTGGVFVPEVKAKLL